MTSNVVEFLVHVIMGTQEVIKHRTLFTHLFHVQQLPEQTFNRVTVLH